VRSRIRIKLKNGKTIEGRADVARGHPLKPMSWAEIGEKFRACARLVLTHKKTEEAIELVANLDRMSSILPLIRAISGGRGAAPIKRSKKTTRKTVKKRPRSKRWSGIRKR
jgi:2-methylcitrate dehydratase PrpD